MKKIIFIVLVTFIFQKNICAQETILQRVDLPGSEIRKINSSIVPQQYELQISLPAGYDKGNKNYPVLYLLDAQWDFPLVRSLYGQQYYDGFIPEIIIVGITWGGIHPNPDSLRARDYTPTKELRSPQSGGAALFLASLKNEIIPFVEKNYRADNTDRILIGCSLGGLFTLYTLFTEPALFQRYVAASPAFGWDKEVIYTYEQKYFENKSTPPAKLFMCVGGVERGVPGFERLAKHLSDRNYSSLQIQASVLENTGHSGTKGEGFARGLQFVFARPSLKLSAEVLKNYAGNYTADNGSAIEIRLINQSLEIYFAVNNKYQLFSADENYFYANSEFLNIHFVKDEKNRITGFKMERYNDVRFFTKK